MAKLKKKVMKEFEKKSYLILDKTERAFEKLAKECGLNIKVIQTIYNKNKWTRLTVTSDENE